MAEPGIEMTDSKPKSSVVFTLQAASEKRK